MAALACTLLPALARAAATPIDGYAATVNNRVITVGDVLEMIQPVEEQLRLTYTGQELENRISTAYSNALESLIDRALIIEEFAAQGGSLPDRYVDDRLESFIRDRFLGDRGAFLEALSEQQITLENWRNDLKDRLTVNLLRRQEVQDKVRISPTQVRARYDANEAKYRTDEQVRISMILLNRGESDSEHAVKLEEASKLVERIRGGEDFAVLAREASEGAKATDGGDLGWIKTADMRAELKTAVAAMKPGEISDPVEAGDELYIIKLDEFRAAGLIPFEEVRKELEDDAREAEAERLYKAWIDRLRRKFYVQVFDTGP
jgi:peptidyl-prolyl cis-trans isomerase SurA